jgi:hypothetical protein
VELFIVYLNMIVKKLQKYYFNKELKLYIIMLDLMEMKELKHNVNG